jgi:hypothetical protein
MIKHNYVYVAIAASVIVIITYTIFLTFVPLGNDQHSNAAGVEHNSTSTICIDDKPCVTTVCINDEPCHTLTSNSTNSHNSTNKKHMTVSPFPQENI